MSILFLTCSTYKFHYHYSEVHVEHESSDSPASRNDLDEKTDPKLSDNNKER